MLIFNPIYLFLDSIKVILHTIRESMDAALHYIYQQGVLAPFKLAFFWLAALRINWSLLAWNFNNLKNSNFGWTFKIISHYLKTTLFHKCYIFIFRCLFFICRVQSLKHREWSERARSLRGHCPIRTKRETRLTSWRRREVSDVIYFLLSEPHSSVKEIGNLKHVPCKKNDFFYRRFWKIQALKKSKLFTI